MAMLDAFERIVRLSPGSPSRESAATASLHPFEARNIYPGFPVKVRKLFDDGHCAEATFEAFKFVEKCVQRHSGKMDSGTKLMNQVFSSVSPLIGLNPLSNQSEKDEQDGYRFLFAGAVEAIRNPRGHEVNMSDDPDVGLDHLAFASMLLRRLEQAGFR